MSALLLGGAALLLVLVGMVVAGTGTDGASPSPLASIGPSAVSSSGPGRAPSSSAAPSASAALDVAGTDAPDLPRPSGAVRIAFEGGIDGAVTWTLSRYRVPAPVDAVRAHYRAAFLEHAWFVGDVAFEDEGWRFVASRGPREVAVELAPDGPGTLATVYLSDLVASATPTPRTPTPWSEREPDGEDERERERDDD